MSRRRSSTAFPASADLLLDVSRRQVDDGMLAEIAAADYGMDGDVHLAELRLIHDQGVIPAPLRWHPGEVLELIRWSNPEDPAHKPGCTGRRGHQMRAFACAALLRAAMGDGREVAEATLAQCLVKRKALGQEMSEAAARFLTWAIPRDAGCEQQWLLAFGLLVVAVRLRSGRIADRVLGDAADSVTRRRSRRTTPILQSDQPDAARLWSAVRSLAAARRRIDP